MTHQPKPPRNGCKSVKRWKSYYLAMALWYEKSYSVFVKTKDVTGSKILEYCQEEASRFRQGALAIESKTHPKIVSGQWK